MAGLFARRWLRYRKPKAEVFPPAASGGRNHTDRRRRCKEECQRLTTGHHDLRAGVTLPTPARVSPLSISNPKDRPRFTAVDFRPERPSAFHRCRFQTRKTVRVLRHSARTCVYPPLLLCGACTQDTAPLRHRQRRRPINRLLALLSQ